MEITPTELARWREEFEVTRHGAYLNHAAMAPLPRRTVERMAGMLRATGAGGDRHWQARMDECERIRSLAAGLFGAARPQQVAFVANTATGLSLIAEGLDWQPGDNVVGIGCEFPSNVYPWLGLTARGVEYRAAAEHQGAIDPGQLLALADERTRVMAVSWVQYASGQRLDLGTLGGFCRERGILLVVDVIQGLGVLPLDVELEMVDACAAATHKWLLGPEGLGLLWVSDRIVERIEPRLRGWASMGHREDWEQIAVSWADGALRFECGTFNMVAIHGLGASLELLAEVGGRRVERRALELADRAAAGLEARGWRVLGDRGSLASAVVAATHPRLQAATVASDLRRQGVIVSHRRGRLRVAPHFYNSEHEIDRLLELLPA